MRSGVSKKLLLLITLLSLALIVVSVLVSSRLYAYRLEQDAKRLCRETADSLEESLKTAHVDFINNYRGKIMAVYNEHREELEQASRAEFESFDKREEFYDAMTEGIFPPKNALGLSYEMLEFKNEYDKIRSEMDMLSFAGGLDVASVFIYDAEHGNMVYLIDRMPEGSNLYMFPASVAKPDDERLSEALDQGVSTQYIAGSRCYALKPVSGAENVFVLFGELNTDINRNVRLYSLYTLALLLGATVIIGLFTLMFANRLIVKNVKKLTEATERFTSEIGGGKPERVSADITSNDEIGVLSEKFELMQDSILGYLGTLADKTSKEEKMKAELELAARIQSESLPKGGLRAGGAELESLLKPAREVGGDLYDYFMLDDRRMFFCLADVSGKGVPASLFMMRAKELIRAHVMKDNSLSELACKLNNELCSGNEESIFITAFFGVLDTESGRLSCLRAGHEQPMLRRGGEVRMIGEESNFVLGVFEDMSYTAEEIALLPGDALLMYTDGLNEGINARAEAFGYDRIASTLKTASGDITAAEYEALLDFCGGEEQFDDVTMLSLRFSSGTRLIVNDPDFNDIPPVTDAILSALSGFEGDRVSEVGLMIDEIMNNQISYAFADTANPRISVELGIDGDNAKLIFEDNGMAFDPLSDVTDEDRERSEGGYGLLLVKALSDYQHYERVGGLNLLTIVKNMGAHNE